MTCSKLVDDLDRNWSALTHDASGESYACCAADLSLSSGDRNPGEGIFSIFSILVSWLLMPSQND